MRRRAGLMKGGRHREFSRACWTAGIAWDRTLGVCHLFPHRTGWHLCRTPRLQGAIPTWPSSLPPTSPNCLEIDRHGYSAQGLPRLHVLSTFPRMGLHRRPQRGSGVYSAAASCAVGGTQLDTGGTANRMASAAAAICPNQTVLTWKRGRRCT
ncbi:hypothetical protein BU26DRAFT_275099 [Trematosphaeria pertusa]|uniref:Uncharacterized protein n=1 Tax=Trematosphaeria pertusa TaxID=390896 RepID=A0A6A6IKX1_9PLEO|nr:uncharacterized protein BU26DRAFT_275099 [Trematosphaeria pertusa]KAF2251036.1 hypothetical protein BU26DRAFT_275099 [Trematosphaeria pertusa]